MTIIEWLYEYATIHVRFSEGNIIIYYKLNVSVAPKTQSGLTTIDGIEIVLFHFSYLHSKICIESYS